MIITIVLVNTSIISHNYHFFYLVRTFKIYSLSNFQAYNTVFVVVQLLSHVWLFVTPLTAAHQASLSLPSPGACSDSCLLSQRYHPTNISSVPFSSCPQSFPTSGSFLMSWHFASGHQSIRASALASVLLMNIHDWFPLGLTGLISLESKGS